MHGATACIAASAAARVLGAVYPGVRQPLPKPLAGACMVAGAAPASAASAAALAFSVYVGVAAGAGVVVVGVCCAVCFAITNAL